MLYLNNNPTFHRVLRRFEIENYLFDKEILKKYCTSQGLAFDDGAYDAFVTDIDNQDIKAEFNRFKNMCNIAGPVNALQFKFNLAELVTPDTAVYADLKGRIFDRA